MELPKDWTSKEFFPTADKVQSLKDDRFVGTVWQAEHSEYSFAAKIVLRKDNINLFATIVDKNTGATMLTITSEDIDSIEQWLDAAMRRADMFHQIMVNRSYEKQEG